MSRGWGDSRFDDDGTAPTREDRKMAEVEKEKKPLGHFLERALETKDHARAAEAELMKYQVTVTVTMTVERWRALHAMLPVLRNGLAAPNIGKRVTPDESVLGLTALEVVLGEVAKQKVL